MSHAIPGWLRLVLIGGSVAVGLAIAVLFLLPQDDPSPFVMAPPVRRVPDEPVGPLASPRLVPAPDVVASVKAPPAPVVAPPAPPLAVAPPPAPTKPSFDVVTMSPEGSTVIAGRAMPDADVTVRNGAAALGHVKADSRGNWVLLPDKNLPAGPQSLTLAEKLADGAEIAGTDHVDFVVPAPAPPPSQVASAAPSIPAAGAESPAAPVGQVVVQPGQTLWRLATAAYGSGPRYVVIYRANQGQIRQPNLIYPGQTLEVPPAASSESGKSEMPDSSIRSR